MSFWIVGTAHLGVPQFVGWDRGDEHPAFEYLGVCDTASSDGGNQ